MNPFLRAPRLRWRVPSFLTLVGLCCFGFAGWTLFDAMDEEQALETLFQPEAETMMRARAAELWANRGEEGLPRLKEALASDDPSTREFALLALIYMPTKDAVLARAEVQPLLDDPDTGVQSNALVLMAKLTDQPEQFATVAASRLIASDLELADAGKTAVQRIGMPAVPAVVRVLPQAEPMIQRTCLDFLAHYAFNEQHGPLVVQAIAETLQAEDGELREAAYTLMSSIRPLTAEEIGAGLKDQNYRIVRIALSEAVRSESPDLENLPRLMGLMKTKPYCRVSALNAIAVYGSRASGRFGDIQQWTQDSDPRVRAEAVTTMVRIADDSSRAVPFLEQLLLDSHPEVACRSAQLLAEVAPETVPVVISQVLLPRLSSPSVPTQVSAAAALSGLPAAAAEHRFALIRLLADQSSESEVAPAVQFQLTEALGNMGPNARDAVPVLLGLVQRSDWNDPQLIVPLKALGKIGVSDPIVVNTLLQLHSRLNYHSRQLRVVVLETLGQLGQGHANVFNLLVTKSRDASSPRERLVALRAMVACHGDSQTTQATLTLALSDEDINVRIAACLLLAEQEDVEEITSSVASLLEDEHPFLRLLAAHTLARLGPQARSAEASLTHALKSSENYAASFCNADEHQVNWDLFDENVQKLRRGSVHNALQSALTAIRSSQDKVQTAQHKVL